MSANPKKRFILPFLLQKNVSPEFEASAVYALAELERSKGSGFLAKQPEERLAFIAKIGYPIWLYPKNGSGFVFDGFNDSSYVIQYPELPSTKKFIENLEANLRPREKFLAYLSASTGYFQQPVKEGQFIFRGLIRDADFQMEFNYYRGEAFEAPLQSELSFLSMLLDEKAICIMVGEFERLQMCQKEEAERLTEAIKLLNKTANQHQIELDFEASAAKEEIDAKIKAQEEIVNPKIAEINMNYKHEIKVLADNFNREIENLQKLKTKALKTVDGDEKKIRVLQHEAKVHSEAKHKVREKRVKEKIKIIQKGLKSLKKELKNIEKKLKNTVEQKTQLITKLHFDLDAEMKLARQPFLELEIAIEAKIRAFRAETDKMLTLNAAVVDGVNKSIAQRDLVKAKFETLSINNQAVKVPAVYYVPFFVVCYDSGSTIRYLVIPPSKVGNFDFSAKLKSALGVSKIKNLIIPRFKALSTLTSIIQLQVRQNSVFENQLRFVSEKNNLLRSSKFQENVEKGLLDLRSGGWLSEKEYLTILGQLKNS